MSNTQMLIVAGYPDVDLAETEFRALAAMVEAKELSSQGMILVGKDADGEPRLIERPKLYDGLALEERTAIVKIHGAVDRAQPDRGRHARHGARPGLRWPDRLGQFLSPGP